jgi:hypothetical protein
MPLQTIVDIVNPETFLDAPADAPKAAEWITQQLESDFNPKR